MDWLEQHWQTITALGIVALTVVVFVWKLTRKKAGGCGSGCGCEAREEGSKFRV